MGSLPSRPQRQAFHIQAAHVTMHAKRSLRDAAWPTDLVERHDGGESSIGCRAPLKS